MPRMAALVLSGLLACSGVLTGCPDKGPTQSSVKIEARDAGGRYLVFNGTSVLLPAADVTPDPASVGRVMILQDQAGKRLW